MNAALVQLEIALETMVTNEPINRMNGREDLADLEAKNAAEYRQALGVLRAAAARQPSFRGGTTSGVTCLPKCVFYPACMCGNGDLSRKAIG